MQSVHVVKNLNAGPRQWVAGALKPGDITAREAQEARYDIALKVKISYHPGYVRPLELGGADFLCVCLSYFGGWRSPVSEVMSKVGHTGDGEPTHSHDAVDVRSRVKS